MIEYPMTFDELVNRFATEEQCREYLYMLRFPNGFLCPKCKGKKSWKINDILYECIKCSHQTSVIAGTVFQDTRKPLKTWFIAIWWVTTQKNGASAKGLQQVRGLKSYQTAWTWLHKIRKAMVNPQREKLSGDIELDEMYFGGSKDKKQGRGGENQISIAIAVELRGKQLGRVRMNVINDASSNSLHTFICKNIEPGSKVITDAWNGYNGIENKGFIREIHKQTIASHDDEMLPHVHMIASLLKRWLLGTHQGAISEKHFQSYLDEYVFRFNRRKAAKRGLLFYKLLECALAIEPTTYKDIINH
jgi:transposase-like protein/Zn ribbon nucleic-acid-binding protein